MKILFMNNRHTPLQIEGISESLYAGFWSRLGSLLLDFGFTLPILLIHFVLISIVYNIYYFTCIVLYIIKRHITIIYFMYRTVLVKAIYIDKIMEEMGVEG